MSERKRAMLARRTAAQTHSTEGLSCPRELRTPCVVWDWLSVDEATDVERKGMNSPFVIRAWRRWQDERRSYAERVGLGEAAACGPTGRPTLQRSDLR
ncbi:hypothetical protein [Streptomyces sp. AC512_CC834]|uniref:hypothetical protein n=1 Tax=Streptomyces sp. AC512_CC834 TaxID=2823691 RepID=UPI001C26D28F|nr:hypothetical protein [Streptomyces sp. AC512_CC834]